MDTSYADELGLVGSLILHPELWVEFGPPERIPCLLTDDLLIQLVRAAAQIFSDHSTVSIELLQAHFELEAGTYPDMVEELKVLSSMNISHDAAKAHHQRLNDVQKAREIISSINSIERAPRPSESLSEFVRRLREDVQSLALVNHEKPETLVSAVDLSTLINETRLYQKTGFAVLDNSLGGLPKGRVTILGARTSHGKTAVALEVAMRVLEMGARVVVFTAELSAGALAKRMSSRLKARGESSPEHTIAQWDLFVDECSRPSASHMASVVSVLCRQKPPDLIVFDYLDYAGESHDIESLRLQASLMGCHQLARSTGSAFLVLSQLNRNVEARGYGSKPRLADLRWTGAAEQIAEIVLLLNYPWMRWQSQTKDLSQATGPPKSLLEVFVEKNSHGPLGRFELHLDNATGTVSELSTCAA